jgi:hypothetical protein
VEDKLFVVAVSAVKTDPGHIIARLGVNSYRTVCASWGGEPCDTYNGSGAWVARAANKEAAEAWALESLKETQPESEGWRMHSATATEIDADLILDVAYSLCLQIASEDEPAELVN